jgi:hypothetical protein
MKRWMRRSGWVTVLVVGLMAGCGTGLEDRPEGPEGAAQQDGEQGEIEQSIQTVCSPHSDWYQCSGCTRVCNINGCHWYQMRRYCTCNSTGTTVRCGPSKITGASCGSRVCNG